MYLHQHEDFLSDNKKMMKKFTNKDYKFEVIDMSDSRCLIKLIYSNFIVGSISIDRRSGCCGVIDFYNLNIYYHNKKNAQYIIEVVEAYAKYLGYSIIMGTTVNKYYDEEDNFNNSCEKMTHILNKFNFRNIKNFVNSRTNNTVSIWIKQI